VLQDGHDAWNPLSTCREADRQLTGTVVLLSEVADRDSPKAISPALAPGAFQTLPPRAWGPAATSTDSPVPLLRAGPDVETRPKSLSGGHTPRRGPRSRAECPHHVEPHAEDITRGRSGISVGRKMALNRNYCCSVTIQTLGIDTPPRNAWPPAPLPTPRSRFGIFVGEALNPENARRRWMPAVQHPVSSWSFHHPGSRQR